MNCVPWYLKGRAVGIFDDVSGDGALADEHAVLALPQPAVLAHEQLLRADDGVPHHHIAPTLHLEAHRKSETKTDKSEKEKTKHQE